jgi:hypothetical protein
MLLSEDTYSKLKKSVERGTASAEAVRFYADEAKRRDTDKSKVQDARKDALKVAEDFYYPQSVKDAISSCNSVEGINRIMKNAKKFI